jgi:hypothetical protein
LFRLPYTVRIGLLIALALRDTVEGEVYRIPHWGDTTMRNRWILTLFVLAALVHAQVDTGVISGSVSDSSGAVVPAASINVQNLGTGQSLVIQTNQSGVYVSPPLRPGEYSVEA